MKLQILPNWCKKIGLILFFSFFVLSAFEEFRKGWYSVGTINYKPLMYSEFINKIGRHYFEIIGILGILMYMLSKEKVEDDYINQLRLESYQFTAIVGLLISILLYAFSEDLNLTLDYFFILFMFFYLITFFIKKRIY